MKLVVQMLKFEKKEYLSIFFMQDDTRFNGNIYFAPLLLWKWKNRQTNKTKQIKKKRQKNQVLWHHKSFLVLNVITQTCAWGFLVLDFYVSIFMFPFIWEFVLINKHRYLKVVIWVLPNVVYCKITWQFCHKKVGKRYESFAVVYFS